MAAHMQLLSRRLSLTSRARSGRRGTVAGQLTRGLAKDLHLTKVPLTLALSQVPAANPTPIKLEPIAARPEPSALKPEPVAPATGRAEPAPPAPAAQPATAPAPSPAPDGPSTTSTTSCHTAAPMPGPAPAAEGPAGCRQAAASPEPAPCSSARKASGVGPSASAGLSVPLQQPPAPAGASLAAAAGVRGKLPSRTPSLTLGAPPSRTGDDFESLFTPLSSQPAPRLEPASTPIASGPASARGGGAGVGSGEGGGSHEERKPPLKKVRRCLPANASCQLLCWLPYLCFVIGLPEVGRGRHPRPRPAGCADGGAREGGCTPLRRRSAWLRAAAEVGRWTCACRVRASGCSWTLRPGWCDRRQQRRQAQLARGSRACAAARQACQGG
jgi:hypothetical protein